MRLVSGLVLTALCAMSAQAQMYRWTDDSGQVHYSDINPGNAETYTPTDTNVSPPYAGGSDLPTIRIYTAEWCGSCKRAKNYMREKDITFVEYDIEKDPHGRNEYRMLGGRGVPFITCGDQKMHGFSPARFEKMLKAAQPDS